jgi:hypothetical protein
MTLLLCRGGDLSMGACWVGLRVHLRHDGLNVCKVRLAEPRNG